MVKLEQRGEQAVTERMKERQTVFEMERGRLRVRLQIRRPSCYGTRGSIMLVLDTSWHDRPSWKYGAGYIGNRTTWVGWRVKGGRDRHGFLRREPHFSVGFLTRNGNKVPYCG